MQNSAFQILLLGNRDGANTPDQLPAIIQDLAMHKAVEVRLSNKQKALSICLWPQDSRVFESGISHI